MNKIEFEKEAENEGSEGFEAKVKVGKQKLKGFCRKTEARGGRERKESGRKRKVRKGFIQEMKGSQGKVKAGY